MWTDMHSFVILLPSLKVHGTDFNTHKYHKTMLSPEISRKVIKFTQKFFLQQYVWVLNIKRT